MEIKAGGDYFFLLSLLMKWRFENRIQKQMDSLKKVCVCHVGVVYYFIMSYPNTIYFLSHRDLMTSSAQNYWDHSMHKRSK